MKRTSKVISIILSVFMLMQMMTGVVFAASKLPTDLHYRNGCFKQMLLNAVIMRIFEIFIKIKK